MFCEISDHNREVIVDWTKLMSDISSHQDHQLTYTPICMIILVNGLLGSETQSNAGIYWLVISSN